MHVFDLDVMTLFQVVIMHVFDLDVMTSVSGSNNACI